MRLVLFALLVANMKSFSWLNFSEVYAIVLKNDFMINYDGADRNVNS